MYAHNDHQWLVLMTQYGTPLEERSKEQLLQLEDIAIHAFETRKPIIFLHDFIMPWQKIFFARERISLRAGFHSFGQSTDKEKQPANPRQQINGTAHAGKKHKVKILRRDSDVGASGPAEQI